MAAVVVGKDGEELKPEAIRQALRELLSAYKVPTLFEVRRPEEVRWLATGKPDKRGMAAEMSAVQ